MGETDDADWSGYSFQGDQAIEILNPHQEELHNEDCGIRSMPWNGRVVIGWVPRVLKEAASFSIAKLVYEASKIHLANPESGVIITLLLLLCCIAREAPESDFISTSHYPGGSGTLWDVSSNTVGGTFRPT